MTSCCLIGRRPEQSLHLWRLMSNVEFAPTWADRYADYLTIVALCTQLLEGLRPLSDQRRDHLRQLRARAFFRAKALEQEPHEH
jgi:hypothetical protein